MTARSFTTHPALADDGVPRTNWSGNYHYSSSKVFQPATVAEVQDAVRSVSAVRALGTRHCFNHIADSHVAQISTLKLKDISIAPDGHGVTVGAGIRYGDLAEVIDAEGYALHNLASLPHISVGGAVATATHGSGMQNGNLATEVLAIEFVAADGAVHTFSRERDGERFAGAVVNLGTLGIVTHITLSLQPRFEVAQVVYQDLPFCELEQKLREIMGAGYSVSIFTDWQNGRAGELWIKRRVDRSGVSAPLPNFYSSKLASTKLHPIPDHPAEACTDQLNSPGPWYERLPHFKMNFTPSSGQELQSEYFVPFEHGYEAIRAIETLRDQITPHLFITELRTVAGDNLWMSMAYQRPSLAIHFTWKPEIAPVMKLLPQIEAKLAPFQARPHWGKLFTLGVDQIQTLYPCIGDFRALAHEFDPNGKFRNQFIHEHVDKS